MIKMEYDWRGTKVTVEGDTIQEVFAELEKAKKWLYDSPRSSGPPSSTPKEGIRGL